MQSRTINLTFHGIGDPARRLELGEDEVWVSRELFLAVLDSVVSRDDVRITFDDGNASDLEHALDALSERGLSATFFLVAGRLGTPGFLDADGIHSLAAAGMEIGCHGMRHRPWRRLDERALHEELVDARAVLEGIVERPITTAACPFGAYDRRAVRMLRDCGYRTVYTSDQGTSRAGQWLQARTSVRRDHNDDIVERVVSSDTTARIALSRRVRRLAKRWR